MKRFAASLSVACLAASFSSSDASAQAIATYQVGTTTLTLSALTTGLNTPWELLWGPDNFLWMTERGGRISRVNPATGQLLPLLTIPDVTQTGESGLLGMAITVPPAVPPGTNYNVFVVYNYTDAGSLKEKLVRYTYNGTTLSNPQLLLGNITAANTHSGSRLVALPDGTLLMTTGDASNTSNAQNLQSLNGKILRLNQDGTIPANNPIPGSYIYSYGHRNPQGLVRVAATGLVYSSEHGQDTEDEVNLVESNRNYGWPTAEGYCNLPAEQAYCQANNVREPLASWSPTIATAGLTYYNHPAIPGWANSLLMVSLKAGRLTQMPLSANGTTVQQQPNLWSGSYGRLRAICVSPQGRVYLTTSNRDGRGNPAATDDRILVLENLAYSPTATRNSQVQSAFSLYPNPTTRTTMLQLATPKAAPAAVAVFDAVGRQVYATSLNVGQQNTTLSFSSAKPGVYTVRVSLPQSTSTQRLVITH